MFVKIDDNEYINLTNVLKLKITQDQDSYKLLILGKDNINSTSYFMKNNDKNMRYLNNLKNVIEDNTSNNNNSEEAYYLNRKEYEEFIKYKEKDTIIDKFNYKGGYVYKYGDGSAIYIDSKNKKTELTESQYNLYLKLSQELSKGDN